MANQWLKLTRAAFLALRASTSLQAAPAAWPKRYPPRLTRMDDSMKIELQTDDEGLTGRECPAPECEKYFKIQFGTGLEGDVPCTCPYCGHRGPHDEFMTQDQIDYVKSVAVRHVSGMLHKELKKLERRPKRNQFISIGVKVRGSRTPLHYYSEKELEQIVVCDSCTLRYAIYGAFGFCPDCGQHNSDQILNANLAVAEKLLDLAQDAESEVAAKLAENTLEDAVSAFDGFGRETCAVYADKSSDAAKAQKLSFQNIERAADQVSDLFSVNMRDGVSDDQWDFVLRCFQKRHVLAHKMGVIDDEYVRKTGASPSLVGRKVEITAEEARNLCGQLRIFGRNLADGMRSA